MKIRIAVLVTIVALLLLGAIALAQSGGGSDPPTLYTVEQGAASGGIYHLASLTWHVDGMAGGTGYLLRPAGPALRGNGCCCTYLPCVTRNH